MHSRSVDQAILRNTLARAVALPLFVMALLAGLLIWQISQLLVVTREVDRSNEVVTDTNHVLAQFVDLETGFRGFLISGAPDFLDPYNRAHDTINGDLDDLEREVSSSPELVAYLRRVRSEHDQWEAFAREVMATRASGGDYRNVIVGRKGKHLMDAIRYDMAQIVRIEEAQRSHRSQQAQRAATRALAASGGLTVLLGLLLAGFTRGQIIRVSNAYARILAENEDVQSQLRAANDLLEQRVQERTNELARSNTDLLAEVTERRRAEEALRQQADTLRSQAQLLDLAHDAIIVRKTDGTILFWNHGAEEMYGWPSEEAIGRPTHSLLQSRYPEPLERVLDELRAHGRWEGEIIHRRRDGSMLTVASRWAVQLEEAGQVGHILEINSDITRQKVAEDQLKDYAARLEQSNRELQDFALIASHDLQEPLRKIRAFSGLLHEEYAEKLEGDGAEYLDEMEAAAGRMQNLIQDLLILSRVSTRGQPFVPVPLDSVITDVLSDLRARLEETGGRVETEDLPTIEADATQMRQLFQNLIGNALKFHREGIAPVIRIRTEPVPEPPLEAWAGPNIEQQPVAVGVDKAGGHLGISTLEPLPAEEASRRTAEKDPAAASPGESCRILVADNGIGFDEKYLDRIFAPFQRLHGRSRFEGTGMGLAICRKIVERHGGTLNATSVPGEGSTFVITLPVRHSKEDTSRG